MFCGPGDALGWLAGRRAEGPSARPVHRRRPSQQVERFDLVASNTRLLLLPEPGDSPNLCSRLVGGMLRRLSEDEKATFGQPLELAETFADPEKHHGTVFRASTRAPAGLTKGYARGRGGYTDPHGKLKEMFPLGRASVAGLFAAEPHPDWAVARTARRKKRFLRSWRRCSGSPTSAMPKGGGSGTSWRRCWPSACWRALRARTAATGLALREDHAAGASVSEEVRDSWVSLVLSGSGLGRSQTRDREGHPGRAAQKADVHPTQQRNRERERETLQFRGKAGR